jgi:TRAP-type C4-dicarboxylate transport system permease small subunit
MKYFAVVLREMKSFLKLKRMSFSSIEDKLVFLAGIVVLFLMCLTTADVTGRYVFTRPVYGTVEISELLLVFLVWLVAAATQRSGGHIGLDALPELLKRKNSRAYYWLQSFNALPALILFALSAYVFFKDTVDSYAMSEQSFGPLFIKYWPFKLTIAIGCVFLSVRLAIQLIQTIRNIGRKSQPED